MERQQHGFSFEDKIKLKYNIIPNPNYTGKWDGWLNNIPVSIKTEQLGSDVEMADFFRNMNNQEDFYLIVGFWAQEKTNIVAEYVLYIPANQWNSLFDKECGDFFRYMIDNITNNHEDDIKWKEWMKEGKRLWKLKTPNLIRPRFKRDHKTQKRIQCAINYTDFIDYFVKSFEVIINGNN